MSGALSVSVTALVGQLELEVKLQLDSGTLVLVGPNGAGKTSLVLLLLGVLPCRSGRIEVGNVVLFDTERGIDLTVEQRELAYVPQDYALFPHLSVRENVAFAVKSSGSLAADAEERCVSAALQQLGVAELASRRPSTLSGGEKQRVALARALSVRPRALLLDEPLAALDIHSRREVRAFLAETLSALALPTLLITHDAADARALGKQIVVLEAGKVTQTGTWNELKRSPATRFVAEFVAETTP